MWKEIFENSIIYGTDKKNRKPYHQVPIGNYPSYRQIWPWNPKDEPIYYIGHPAQVENWNNHDELNLKRFN